MSGSGCMNSPLLAPNMSIIRPGVHTMISAPLFSSAICNAKTTGCKYSQGGVAAQLKKLKLRTRADRPGSCSNDNFPTWFNKISVKIKRSEGLCDNNTLLQQNTTTEKVMKTDMRYVEQVFKLGWRRQCIFPPTL